MPGLSVTEVQAWLQVATGFATLLAIGLGIVRLMQIQRTMELQADLATKQAERSIWQMTLTHPNVAPQVMKERWGEAGEANLFCVLLLDHYESLYFQHRRGAIPRANWKGIERAMVEHIASPSIRAAWEKHKDLYWPAFVRQIDRAMPPK